MMFISPNTHDLSSLLSKLQLLYPDWLCLTQPTENLSSYAVNIRYPGDSANREDVQQALADVCAVRDQVRASFGLS